MNNLLTTKEAVVHLVNEDNVELMNQTAAPLAEHISEAEEFSLELVPSQKVQVPSLKESNVRLETKLYHHLPLGESGHLVLLEVVNFSFAEELLDEENFQPLHYPYSQHNSNLKKQINIYIPSSYFSWLFSFIMTPLISISAVT